MKKSLLIALVLVVALFACNRKAFVNKLTGTWKISHYIFHPSQTASIDQTATYADTTNVGYTLVFNGDYSYNESWKSYAFRADSAILVDTLGYDTVTMTYHIVRDTIHFVDTTITPFAGTGRWSLINSEEDLELLPSNDTSKVRIFNILTLTKSSLNLLNGNQEYDLKH